MPPRSLSPHESAEPAPTFVIVGGDLDADGAPVGPLADVAEASTPAWHRRQFPARRLAAARPAPRLSTPRPTSWPCRRATSRSVSSRSRRWPAARRWSPPALAACASRSTKGTTGFLVKPQSPPALARASLHDPDGRPPARRRCRQPRRPSVERYDWSNVARQVKHVYRRLAEGHRAQLLRRLRHLRDDRERLRVTGSQVIRRRSRALTPSRRSVTRHPHRPRRCPGARLARS